MNYCLKTTWKYKIKNILRMKNRSKMCFPHLRYNEYEKTLKFSSLTLEKAIEAITKRVSWKWAKSSKQNDPKKWRKKRLRIKNCRQSEGNQPSAVRKSKDSFTIRRTLPLPTTTNILKPKMILIHFSFETKKVQPIKIRTLKFVWNIREIRRWSTKGNLDNVVPPKILYR